MILILLLFLSSCATYSLNVVEERITKEDTASYFAKTPDPHPPVGSQLVLYWKVPKNFKGSIHTSVLFRDLSLINQEMATNQNKSSHTYYFSEYYLKKHKGILSYQVVIKDSEGKVVKSTQHKMWVSLISGKYHE